MKIDFKHEQFIKKLFCGVNEKELTETEKLIFNEFEKLNLLTDLVVKKLKLGDFSLAMDILDNELGKERKRDSKFLMKKFQENSDLFIGVYLGGELVGVVCGFPREDYLLMSEIAVDFRFQRRKFGEKLVKEFEKICFEKYDKINVGALDDAIEFYKSLNYKLFLLIQFEKGVYKKDDFSNFDIISIKDYGIELDLKEYSLEKLNELRKVYSKASLQYIFTKRK